MTDLWEIFSLGGNDPDPGAGILYCLRYGREDLYNHRKHVASALKSMGVTMDDGGSDAILVGYQGDSKDVVLSLLEELSAVNRAEEYAEAGFGNYMDIEEMARGLTALVVDQVRKGEREEAYSATLGIKGVLQELADCVRKGYVMTESDTKAIDGMASIAKNTRKFWKLASQDMSYIPDSCIKFS